MALIGDPAGTNNVYSNWIKGNEKLPTFAARASSGKNITSHSSPFRHSTAAGGVGRSIVINSTPIRPASARATSTHTLLNSPVFESLMYWGGKRPTRILPA